MTVTPLRRMAIMLVSLVALQGGGAAPAAAQQGFDAKPLGLVNGQRKLLHFGQNRAAAIKALGNPTRKSKFYSEEDEQLLDVFHYGTNKLYFLKDQLEDFDLNDNTLAFGKSYEQAFRVGAKLKALPKQQGAKGSVLATTYLAGNTPLKGLDVVATPGRSRNIDYQTIAQNYISYGKLVTDSQFEILFDSTNKIINIAAVSYD